MASLRLHLLAALSLAASLTIQSAGQEVRAQLRRSSYLQPLAALQLIDAHAHVWEDDPIFNSMLERLNLHIVDILYVDDNEPTASPLGRQRAAALAFIRSSHGHASLCTTFDPFRFSQPGFTQTTIEGLNRDFADGAIAVKIWKNIGMELKDSSGRYVLADDPRFEPIYRDIAHLTIQPSPKVRSFLIKYQDRVLSGTDIELSGSERGKMATEKWETQLALDWRYFATADTFDCNGHTVHGLNLPPAVLEKIYHSNAVRWLPGVESSTKQPGF